MRPGTSPAPGVRLLGEIRVSHGEEDVVVGGRPGALLALLATRHGQVQHTDRLAADLWGESLPGNPANAVHRLLVRLRQKLPEGLADALVTRRPGYALLLRREDLDLEVAEELVADAGRLLAGDAPQLAQDRLAQVWRLVGGTPLAGRDEPGLQPIVVRAEELLRRAEELTAETGLILGDLHAVIARLEPLVETHPLHERFAFLLMLARYRAGQQDAALAAYQRVRASLIDELGVEPGPDLRDLHARILRHDPDLRPAPASTPVPSSSPQPAGDAVPLIGRGDELAAFDEAQRLAASGQSVLIDVVGEPGSGKSRLLREFAGRLAAKPGLLVRAHHTDRTDPGSLLRRMPAGHGVVLLDDAELADPTSLTTLALRHAETDGSLMVWSRRPDSGLPPQPLDNLLTGAAGVGHVVVLRLRRLTTGALAAVFAPGTDPDLLRSLMARADGVARDVHDLLDAGLHDGTLRAAPSGLTAHGEVLSAATERPPREDVDEVLELLAVAGRAVPVRVLATALHRTPGEILALARPAALDGRLGEEPTGLVVGDVLDTERMVARLGTSGRGALLDQLASAWIEAGIDGPDAGAVGGYLLAAGRGADAVPLLAEAGLRAADREAHHEALPLVEAALEAAADVAITDDLRGRLLLARADGRALTGPLEGALADANAAIDLLQDAGRQRARVVAGEVAVSLRRPDLVDGLVAAAREEAASEDAHLGELLTLHAVSLGDRGEHRQADAAIATALGLVDRGDDARARAHTHLNAGWVALERGEARLAAERLAVSLVTGRLAGTDHEVNALLFCSRAQFLIGDVTTALENQRRGTWLARQRGLAGAEALASGSRALGMLALDRFEEALEAADTMLTMAVHASPTHEIAARTRRAQALAGLGEIEEAEHEAGYALGLVPASAERMRLATRAIAARIAATGPVPWSAAEMEAIAEQLAAAARPLNVVEVQIAAAASGADPSAAVHALESALELGAPAHAARAAQAGGLWATSGGQRAAAALRMMTATVPAAWRPAWERLAWVRPALTQPLTQPPGGGPG